MVETSQDTFAFFWDIPDAIQFTVISGLVKSDFNQLGLAGAQVAVISAQHAASADSIAATAFNGEYIVIAVTNDDGRPATPIEITFTKKGFKPTDIIWPIFEFPPPSTITRNLTMLQDSDGDGISDAVENASNCLKADDPDTDDDGIVDGKEDKNFNGIKELNETDPCTADRRQASPWIPLLLPGD